MNLVFKSIIVLLLTVMFISGCASNPYGSADDQRSRSKEAQDELSSETRK